MNINNLKIMYDYLIVNRANIEPNFDMSIFREHEDFSNPKCGTQGCMWGWGIGAFVSEQLSYRKPDELDFYANAEALLGIKRHSLVWTFLFSYHWSNVKECSTLDNALSRLKYIIEGGNLNNDIWDMSLVDLAKQLNNDNE